MASHASTARAITWLAAALASTTAGLAVAEEVVVTQKVVAVVAEDEEEVGSRFYGSVQLDITNAYFFRGMLNERDDFIMQPWAELYLNLFASDDGPIRDVSIGFGVWNSIHDDDTLAENSPHNLYETDWYPVISIGLPFDLTFIATYYWYTSPNGAFDTVQELDLEVAWDDSEVLGRFSLEPWMNWAIETERTSLGNDEGVGLQMGVEPLLYEFDNEMFPLAFTAPLELGLSVVDYYEGDDGSDETFGYFSYGVTATLPLEFIDKSFGAWKYILSGKGFHFGNTLAEVDEDDDNYGVVMSSLAVEF